MKNSDTTFLIIYFTLLFLVFVAAFLDLVLEIRKERKCKRLNICPICEGRKTSKDGNNCSVCDGVGSYNKKQYKKYKKLEAEERFYNEYNY